MSGYPIRDEFPQLSRTVYGKPLVYLDNAATSLRPRSVIDRWTQSAASQTSNLHRAVHRIAVEATEAYEQARSASDMYANIAHTLSTQYSYFYCVDLETDEYDDFIAREPNAKKWIRPYVGAREFIHKLPRYCLWLVDCPPNEIRKMPLVYKRVEAVKNFRLASKRADTRKLAKTPWLFGFISHPKTNYLLVPQVSSERREYIPIGYMDANTIASNLVLMIPDAKYWHFGVLTSFPHMVWTRLTCGRLRNDYRYSAEVVYNNFPFPPFWRKVERTAAEILVARQNYPDASFADLYDPLTMPKDLRKAHEENDRAVMEAYDFPKNMSEEKMQVAFLQMYDAMRNMAEIFYGK